MELSFSHCLSCKEPQSEVLKEFDCTAGVPLCTDGQIHSVICLPCIYKIVKHAKILQVFLTIFCPELLWNVVSQQKRTRSPGSECHTHVRAEVGTCRAALAWLGLTTCCFELVAAHCVQLSSGSAPTVPCHHSVGHGFSELRPEVTTALFIYTKLSPFGEKEHISSCDLSRYLI